MKRVASLYLPHWAIDRVRRAERRAAPPSQPDGPSADLLALKALGDAAQGKPCDAPRNSGWRPGARWAREDVTMKASSQDVERSIAALPAHQRPPMRELGRRSEAADHPFRLPTRSMGPDSRGRAQGDRVVTMPRRTATAPDSSPDAGRRGSSTAHTAAPLVTVHRTGSRMEIADACPAAQMLGLVRGMALTQARASVPALDVRDADPAGDMADLTRLAIALARRWTSIVALSGTDGLFLDMTGVAHLHGGEAAMAHRIVRLLARLGVAARIAVADTAGSAWATARYVLRHPNESRGIADARDTPERHGPSLGWGDGILVLPPGAHIPAIAPLPPEALRLEPRAIELLRRFGIDTVGALAALPRAPLVRRFGANVARRIDQATGALPEPLVPVIPPVAIAVTRRFAEPIATAEAIAHWLGTLVPDLADVLAKAGLGARALLLVADRVDHQAQVIRIGLARPTRDPAHILRLLVRRIEEIAPGYGIDALTLHVRRIEPLGAQGFATDLADPAVPDLAPLVDMLANRIGPGRVWRQAPVESDVPERSAATRPPLDAPASPARRLKRDDVRHLDTRTRPHCWHPDWPRPVRLLPRPEPVDHVIAALPDAAPARFTWRGTVHRVVRGDGPERIAGEWWKRTAEHHAIRDYFQVEDEAGQRFWLFRRGDGVRPETGDLAWYVHGTFA